MLMNNLQNILYSSEETFDRTNAMPNPCQSMKVIHDTYAIQKLNSNWLVKEIFIVLYTKVIYL